MSAINETTTLPPRGQHPYILNPLRPKNESPPEVIEHESRPQRRSGAPLAAPGSHGSAIGDARRGLKMSSPANPEPAMIIQQHRTGLSLSRLSGSNTNNPDAHLWSVYPATQSKRRRPVGAMASTAVARGTKLPLQSPLRRVEWWRRPPSPLVSHMHPLWESNSGDDRLLIDNLPHTKKVSRRAPEEGEEAEDEEGGPLPSDGGDSQSIKPTPTEVSPEPEPPVTGTGLSTPFSAISPGSAFSAPDSLSLVRGGWPDVAMPITVAPPPPTMNAPTAASAAAAIAKDSRRRDRSPSVSPESSRPRSVPREEETPPAPTTSPPRRPGGYSATTGLKAAAPPQSRPAQHPSVPVVRRSLPEGGRAPVGVGRMGRGGSSSTGEGRSRDPATGAHNDRRTSQYPDDDVRRLPDAAAVRELASVGNVTPEESTINMTPTGRQLSNGDPAVPEGAVLVEGVNRGRSAPRGKPARRTAKPAVPSGFQATVDNVPSSSDDNNGRGSPPPYLESLAGGKGKPVGRLRVNGSVGSRDGGGGRSNSSDSVVLTRNVNRRGGCLAAGLAKAISEMEKTDAARAGRKKEKRDIAGGENGDSVSGAHIGGSGKIAADDDASRREGRDQGAGGAGTFLRLAYLSEVSSTRTPTSIVRETSRAPSNREQARGMVAVSKAQMNGSNVTASSSDEEEKEGQARSRSSSSSSNASVSTSYTAVSASTEATGFSGTTSWTFRAPSEAAPPSTAGPASPDSLRASDVNGLEPSLAPSAAPPSPTSSIASSSLATSMKNPSRRRVRSRAQGVGKGTRPEREVGSGGGSGATLMSSQHPRRGYQRRRTPPSVESPLSVGAGSARPVVHSRRRPRVNTPGMVGVPRQGSAGGGSGGIGSSGGVRLDDRGLRHMARREDEAFERHYVNPMNARTGITASAPGHTEAEDDRTAKVQPGALAKLLRRLTVLRKRWRRKRRMDAEAGGGGDAASSVTSEAEDDDDVRRMASGRAEKQRDGPADDELEMACRRMLDALWMSAKRGTDTLSISVSDGRSLLIGLLTARGDEDGGIDLGAPLPVLAKEKNASRNVKPLRPVVGGASGPFARAGRDKDPIAGENDFGSRRTEAVALRRAMELALGVTEEKQTSGRVGSGLTNATGSSSSAGGSQSLPEWNAGPNRNGAGLSDIRHEARRSSRRANLHRELRRESAALGLTVGGVGGTGNNKNYSDGGSSKASSALSSPRSSLKSSRHRAGHRRTGSGGSHDRSEAWSGLRPGSSRPALDASGATVTADRPLSSRGGYSDGENEYSSRSLYPGPSSRGDPIAGSVSSVRERERPRRSRPDNTRRAAGAFDGNPLLHPARGGGPQREDNKQRSGGSRVPAAGLDSAGAGKNANIAREGIPIKQVIDGSGYSRTRSRSLARPGDVGASTIVSAGYRNREGERGGGGGDRYAGTVASGNNADIIAGGPSRMTVDGGNQSVSRETRNHAGMRFDDGRRSRSRPPSRKGD